MQCIAAIAEELNNRMEEAHQKGLISVIGVAKGMKLTRFLDVFGLGNLRKILDIKFAITQ